MAKQKINIGKIVNDGLGDDLRTAFQKINGNFDYHEDQINLALSRDAENVGGGARVFQQKEEHILKFRSLLSGRFTVIHELHDGVVIESTVPQPFTRIDTNEGSVFSDGENGNHEITIEGGNDIVVKAHGPTITVDTRGIHGVPFIHILQTYDFGPIDGDFSNPVQLGLAGSNIDFGTADIPGTINLDCGMI